MPNWPTSVPDHSPTGAVPGAVDAAGAPAPRSPLLTPEERQAFPNSIRTFWKDEGVLATVTANARGESGTLFGGAAPRTATPRRTFPHVSITAENYNRIARLVEHNVPVKLTFDINTEFDTTIPIPST